MGNTWEVCVWKEIKWGNYGYESVYAGESWLAALWYFWKTKRAGGHCVKLEWR